jgi:hypothetical protein
MAPIEERLDPIILVLGPFGGGTSAVAKVLHHLGVFMGNHFDWTYRTPHDTWEESHLSLLCRRAFSEPGGQLQMDAGALHEQLAAWADFHRRAARETGGRPGAKHPLLCVAMDFIQRSCGPVVAVAVNRPFDNVLASLNRLGWWADEQARSDSIYRLTTARDNGIHDIPSVRVDFEALRAAPELVVRRLADDLGLQVTEAQVQSAVESVMGPTDVLRDADPHGIDQLLADVDRNFDDAGSVYMWARSYFDSGDYANARLWYARQLELGIFGDEETYVAMWRIAESMAALDEPWPAVQDAYLKAWAFRPTRAEPLHAIARRYRSEGRYALGYLFAERAAQIPLPECDALLADAAVYSWSAIDEQAVCASWIGKQTEAFTLCRRILARPDVPEGDRQRVAGNRDFLVPVILETALAYPEALIDSVIGCQAQTDVTVSLIAGPDRNTSERTLNSILNCCTDVSTKARFLVVDGGLSVRDRAELIAHYPFLEFAHHQPAPWPGAQLAQIREEVDSRFWLHLYTGWQFFAPENLITRLIAVLDSQSDVLQVGVNYADATKLIGASAPEQLVCRDRDAGRFVLTNDIIGGPAMFDTARFDNAGGIDIAEAQPLAEFRRRAAAAGLRTACLDEVLCITQ